MKYKNAGTGNLTTKYPQLKRI